jgi:6-phosphofructokinase
LLAADSSARDASGNVRLQDIGPLLREKVETFFKAEGIPIVLGYFDPSYQVRSRPANREDALFCDLFACHAVHAAMAGKTGVVIGFRTSVSSTSRSNSSPPIPNDLTPRAVGGVRSSPRRGNRSCSLRFP